MNFVDQDPIVVISGPNGNPEEACQVFFQGGYHYCGEAAFGYVLCCPDASPAGSQ